MSLCSWVFFRVFFVLWPSVSFLLTTVDYSKKLLRWNPRGSLISRYSDAYLINGLAELQYKIHSGNSKLPNHLFLARFRIPGVYLILGVWTLNPIRNWLVIPMTSVCRTCHDTHCCSSQVSLLGKTIDKQFIPAAYLTISCTNEI